MAAPMNLLGVFVEVRQQIRAVQAVLCINTSFTDEDSCQMDTTGSQELSRLQVEICPDSLHFITAPDGCRHVFPLAPIRILPKSCNGLHWVQDEGLHMRLQLAGSREAGDRREMDEAWEKEELGFLRSSAFVISCGTCRGKVVTDPCVFDRVLPLPSENWREMAESWCCHGNDVTRTFAGQSLAPSEKDCLVGNLYFLMHPSMLCKDALLLAPRKGKKHVFSISQDKDQTLQLQCRRCRSSLGEAVTGESVCKGKEWHSVHTLKLLKHSICMQPLEGDATLTRSNIFSSYNTESYLAKHLACMSQMNTTFKFILEEESSDQPYLLLWLLSSDTLILTSETSPPGLADIRFHGNRQREPREASRVTNCKLDECCWEAGGEVRTHAVEAHRIVKVLYQALWDEGGKRAHRNWSKDLSVQCMPLPKAMCLELMLLLEASNQHTPASMRHMNGFKVGYLRL
ncbi:E3 ubiquitin-protein ligase E3D-like [Acanthaster planci]|uniref:E3 ubiquitin-protein ligase E3D n=1 Tax=Acanthaster planci TaxID=133434 RepID=A0A8B7ZF80_ACAPL|nr:E3 ubiquitin-protein ligase E3D-like [Acanthaster planci]